MFKALLENEWMKFRRRRRVAWTAVGIVVAVGLLSVLSYRANSPSMARAFAVSHYHYPVNRHLDPVTQAGNRFFNWEETYNNALALHRPLPSLRRGLVLAEAWHRAEQANPGPNPVPEVRGALQTVLQLRFAIAHHLEFQPERATGIMSGALLVQSVFSTTSVLVVALLVLFVAGDGLAMETASGTWNSLWADPVPRRTVVLAKLVWMAILVVGVTAVTTGLLWLVGDLLYGTAPLWPVAEAHWSLYPVHSQSVSTYYMTIIRRVSDLHFQSMRSAALQGAALAVVPLLAVTSVATLLGLLLPSGVGSGLAAVVFAAGPVLATTGNVHTTWFGALPGLYLPMGAVETGVGINPSMLLTWTTGLAVAAIWAAVAWAAIGVQAYRKEW